MKKLMIVAAACIVLFSTPVWASEADLLARIEALEARVAALEALLGGSAGTDMAETLSQAGEPVTLEVGTWIVGEDIPAGKYDLTCSSDAGSMCTVYASLDDKLNNNLFVDLFSVTTEAYKEQYASYFSDDQNISAMLDSLQTIIHNTYLQDGQCLDIEGAPMMFTPVG